MKHFAEKQKYGHESMEPFEQSLMSKISSSTECVKECGPRKRKCTCTHKRMSLFTPAQA